MICTVILYTGDIRRTSRWGKNRFHLDLKRGKRLDRWSQCFAVWIPDELRGKAAMTLFDGCCEKFRRELAPYRSETFSPVLTVEGGAVLGGKLANLEKLADRGVKMMTLTWNGENELGGGADTALGLTPFGREALKEMERLSIVADVSHASDALFYDVAEIAEKPIVASHSNARAVCPHRRNLTDRQFQILRDKGGLVGLNFCVHFCGRTPTLILKTFCGTPIIFGPWAGRLPCVWALITMAPTCRRSWTALKKCRTFTSFF